MNFAEQDKYTAIVTGSTRGIGKETALLLLQKGSQLQQWTWRMAVPNPRNVIHAIHGD